MNKTEFATFAAQLKTFYPRDSVLPNAQAMELWYKMLGDISYPVAEVVLQKWVALEKWSPTIADIRAGAAKLCCKEPDDWTLAWSEVTRAVGRYGQYREDEALASMSDTTREIVRRLSWKELCRSENIMAYRAAFRDAYNNLTQKERQYTQLPPSLQTALEGGTKLYLRGDE